MTKAKIERPVMTGKHVQPSRATRPTVVVSISFPHALMAGISQRHAALGMSRSGYVKFCVQNDLATVKQ